MRKGPPSESHKPDDGFEVEQRSNPMGASTKHTSKLRRDAQAIVDKLFKQLVHPAPLPVQTGEPSQSQSLSTILSYKSFSKKLRKKASHASGKPVRQGYSMNSLFASPEDPTQDPNSDGAVLPQTIAARQQCQATHDSTTQSMPGSYQLGSGGAPGLHTPRPREGSNKLVPEPNVPVPSPTYAQGRRPSIPILSSPAPSQGGRSSRSPSYPVQQIPPAERSSENVRKEPGVEQRQYGTSPRYYSPTYTHDFGHYSRPTYRVHSQTTPADHAHHASGFDKPPGRAALRLEQIDIVPRITEVSADDEEFQGATSSSADKTTQTQFVKEGKMQAQMLKDSEMHRRWAEAADMRRDAVQKRYDVLRESHDAQAATIAMWRQKHENLQQELIQQLGLQNQALRKALREREQDLRERERDLWDREKEFRAQSTSRIFPVIA